MKKINYQKKTRNFSIIAHIDHGKSTLADRFLENSKNIRKDKLKTQILDSLDIEKERGITIKLNTVRLLYHDFNQQEYIFNLIDTPGHADFNYEVSRSLASCDGALLLVDITQGIQSQTIINFNLAKKNDLFVIPVINKIDLQRDGAEELKIKLEKLTGFSKNLIPMISSKTGENISSLIEKIINYLPYPKGEKELPLQALIFDSFYDRYKGVIIFFCIKNGTLKVGNKIKTMSNNQEFIVNELGIKTLEFEKKDYLQVGDIGWLSTSIKDLSFINIGDTITNVSFVAEKPLPGYLKIKPMVFCGIYPTDSFNFNDLFDAISKIKLNDSSLVYEIESSPVLGKGIRCGFLGLLHIEIIKERLEREYNLKLLLTLPSVDYQVQLKKNQEILIIDNPIKMPEWSKMESIAEPFARIKIFTPKEFANQILLLCKKHRGEYENIEIYDDKINLIIFLIPLSEIIYDFYDKMKSISKGYATFDYEHIGYRKNKLVKVDILINKKKIDILSIITNFENAVRKSREMCENLKNLISRHQFEIVIQAAINNKIIARETIKPYRKDVTKKLYGGDYTRKQKLLEKQKEGKKRMKKFGNIEIPSSVFRNLLKTN